MQNFRRCCGPYTSLWVWVVRQGHGWRCSEKELSRRMRRPFGGQGKGRGKPRRVWGAPTVCLSKRAPLQAVLTPCGWACNQGAGGGA